MLQNKTDNPLDGLHLETYVRADADGVASCAAGLLAARCAEAVSRRGVFTLALAGGSTPLALFRLLRTAAWAERIDWAHTRVFWVDERCVAPEHPASNYGAANQELLAHVPAAEIYPMDGEIDPGEKIRGDNRGTCGPGTAEMSGSRVRAGGFCAVPEVFPGV